MPRSETTPKGELVKDYLSRFKNTPTLSLAKKIFSENSLMFKDVETVRSLVRVYRGKSGDKKRDSVQDKQFFGTGGLQLPRSLCEPYVNYKMPKASNRILALFDIHFPFHSEEVIEMALMHAKERDANTLLLGGDIVDFYELSHFSKEPRIATFREEREMFWQFIDAVRQLMPNIKIIWLEGNHERRYEKYLMTKAPEIYDTEEFNLDILFKCGELGIEYIGDKRIIEAGKLRIIHGDEYGGGISTPVNAARSLFLKYSTKRSRALI